MARFKVTVPPTAEQGSYSTIVSDGGKFGMTVAQEALWDYNSARAHDGLPPINRMPAGTKYQLLKSTKPTEQWITDMVKSGDLPKQRKGFLNRRSGNKRKIKRFYDESTAKRFKEKMLDKGAFATFDENIENGRIVYTVGY